MRPLEEEMVRMIPVVKRVARRFARSTSLDEEEAVGVGLLNMVKAVREWKEKEGEAPLEAWVGLCARRAMVSELRRTIKAKVQEGGRAAVWREGEKKRQVVLPHVDGEEERAEVERAMEVVRGRERKGEEIAEMVGLLARGLKGREVEVVMGVKKQTVRTRLHMVRVSLGR